jgi:hypothetical protein
MTPTNYEIAENFVLWGEYHDTDGLVSKDDFDAMTLWQRLDSIIEAHGGDGSEPAGVGYTNDF